MKKFYLSFSIILAAGIICIAQTGSAATRSTGSAASTIKGGQVFSSATSAAVDAQLQKSIDVKNAKVGDQVILKTTKAIKEKGETVIPKGTNLIGHITEVQQRSKDNAMSKIGMVFDRIEGKNLDAPITASIISITNAQAAAAVGDTLSSTASGSYQTSTSTSGGGSSGGLLGGVGGAVGSTVGGVTNTVGGLSNTATQTVGSVANTASQTLGSTTGTVGQTLNGIQISNSVNGSTNSSTILSTPNNNLKLEKGLTFQMQLNSQSGKGDQPGT